MPKKRKTRGKIKQLVTGFVFVTLVVIILSPVFLLPKETKAQLGVRIHNEIMEKQLIETAINTLEKNLWDQVIKEAWAVAWRSALDYFLQTMAYDMGVWLGSGGEGEKPMFFTEGWGEYLRNVADEAAGEFIEEFASGAWGDDFVSFLCEPDYSLKLAITLGLEKTVRPERPECTLSELVDNWEEEFRSPDFLSKFSRSFDPYGNDFGIVLTAYSQFFTAIEEKKAEKTLVREEGKGFKAVTEKISGALLSPSKAGEQTFEEYLKAGKISPTTRTGYIVADAINTFLNTLMGQLLQTIWQGLWSPDDDYRSPSFSTLTYEESATTPGGRQAAEARFAGLLEVGRRVGGPYEILSKLVVCPDENNPGPTDCVIEEPFRRAIERELTVQQAIDQGYLDGDAPFGFTPQGFEPSYKEGYPYRSLLILRKYRIIPVGWEIAAQYINQFADKGVYGLNDLIADFDNPSSPFYGLVDPNWVLKAPEYYCGLEGYGPISSEDITPGFDNNGDGDFDDPEDTPGSRSVFRTTYCADEQSCISEDENGNCQYYGYCTKEKRIWRFNGEACPDYYNTCTTFTATESGQTTSYLKNTLDFANCNADNAGCQWYCTEYNPIDNIWTCDAQNERVLKKCETVGKCDNDDGTGSQDPCIRDSQCPFGETCENVGCELTASCTIPEGEGSCTVGDVILRYNCPQGGGDCDLSESCTIPYGGISCTIPGCDTTQSLVSNYSFEEAPTNFNEVAADWTGDRNYFLRVTGSGEKVYAGSYSTRFYSSGGTANTVTLISTQILLSDNSVDYTLSGWFYDNLVIGKVRLEVENVATTNTLCQTSDYSLKGEWINLGCNFQIPAPDTSVVVKLVIDSGTTSGPVGTAWFDYINLQEECLSQSVELALAGTVEKNESKLYLDRDAETCDAEDAGCSRFIRLVNGTNIVINGSFEDDLSESWKTTNSTISQFSDQTYVGLQAVKINFASGETPPVLFQNINFLKPNTEYVLSGYVYIPNSTTLSDDWYLTLQVYGCDWATFGQSEDNNYCYFKYDESNGRYLLPTTEDLVRESHKFTDSTPKDSWQLLRLRFKTLSQIDGTGLVKVGPDSISSAGEIYLDGIQIMEATTVSSYVEYGSTNIVNLKSPPDYLGCTGDPANDPSQCNNYALVCTEEEVGCNLYTPVDGDPPVPAIVSDQDFCPAECVGYQTFKQSATNYEQEKFPQYFIPATANLCSATNVGCEEFTNLDEVARGGEGREYYTYIRQCIKPSQTLCGTFYTWVGSDETGYQLRVYNLKQAGNEPEEIASPRTDLGNCDNALDALENPYCKEFYAQDGSVSYHILQNTISCTDDCHPFRITYLDSEDIDEVSCGDNGGTWLDEGGETICYYCSKYGGTLENPDVNSLGEEYCLYNAVPAEGVSCPASEAGCREYKGNAAANVRIVFEDDFEDGESSGWSVGVISNESTYVSGHSLATEYLAPDSKIETMWADLGEICGPGISNPDLWNPQTATCTATDDKGETCQVKAEEQYCSLLDSLIIADSTYLLSFWAMSGDGQLHEGVEARLNWNGGLSGLSLGTVDVGPEWQYYQLGPEFLGDFGQGIYLSLSFGQDVPFYFDEIILKEVSQYTYLIKDSWNTPESCDTNPLLDPDIFPPPNAPQYMLGCEEYRDYYGQTVYLKSFTNLCRESAVGCEALIDTHNSTSPFEELYNEGFANSDIVVPADSVTYLVNDSAKQCASQNVGCQALALPVLDPDSGQVLSLHEAYLINNPDQYSSILCSEEAYGCKEYQTTQGFDYFKEPGNRTCEYKQVPDQQTFGWYKTGTNYGEPDCPLTKTPLGIARPAKACQGGARSGLYCDDDSQCPDGRCMNWAGLCPREEDSCSEYVDPISEISENIVFNSGFEQDVDVNGVPDGWQVVGSPILDYGQNNNEGYEGSTGIRLITDASNILSQTFNIKSRTLYTFSAKIRKVDATADAILKIYDANADLVSPDNSMQITVDEAEIIIANSELSENNFTSFSGRFYSGDATTVTITFGGTGGEGHWFDEVSVYETGIYYYLDNSVDKTGCNGLVNYEKGCVLFNNRGNINYSIGEDDFTYLIFNADQSPTEDGVASTECVNACNADELIKVRPDRICGEWLNCSSVVKSITPEGIEEDYCVALNHCASLDPNGNCDYVIPAMGVFNQTVQAGDTKKLRNLSGYSTAGVDWRGVLGPDIVIYGLYHYSLMPQIGELANVPNGNFELYYSTLQPVGWTNPLGSWDKNQFKVVNDPVAASVAEGVTIKEGRSILKIGSAFSARSSYFDVFSDTTYVLNAFVNTLNLKPDEAKTQIKIEAVTGTLPGGPILLSIDAGLDWTNVLHSFTTGADNNMLKISLNNWLDERDNLTGAAGSDGLCDDLVDPIDPTGTNLPQYCDIEGASYYDQIEIRPVLTIQSPTFVDRDGDGIIDVENNLAPSCRVYPEDSSLSCNYFDDSGLEHRGILGYCLISDPQNPDICLQWWPVDLIKGDLFGNSPGYSDRMPLYYCMVEKQEADSEFINQFRNLRVVECSGAYCCRTVLFAAEAEGAGCGDCPANCIETVAYPDGYWDINLGNIQNIFGQGGQASFCCNRTPGCPITRGIHNYTNDNYVPPSLRDPNWSGDPDFIWGFDCGYGGEDKASIWVVFKEEPPEERGYISSITLCQGDWDPHGYECRSVHVDFNITDFEVPTCSIVAQTVTPTGSNKSWLSRISEGSNYEVIDLNYTYNSDYPPFGGAVPPAPVDFPPDWDSRDTDGKQPLYVEAPNLSFSAPYQARAGSSYSCFSDLSLPGTSPGPSVDSVCETMGICSESNAICAIYPYRYNLNLAARVTCPEPDEICDYTLFTDDFTSIEAAANVATMRVKRLFARSYGIWIWDGNEYSLSDPSYNWSEPDEGCWIATGENSRPDYPDDLCAVAPLVTNISIGSVSSGDFIIHNSASISLTFNTIVDANQLPVTAYRVNWGDGSEIAVTGTSLRDQSHPENPYTLAHAYSYWDILSKNKPDDDIYCYGESPPANWPSWLSTPTLTKSSCAVLPRIQVIDNWGWCNGNIDPDTGQPVEVDQWGYYSNKCQNNNNAWTYFNGVVVVYE